MRDRTGPLGTCLANVPRGDSAKPPCSLRARESPRPPGGVPGLGEGACGGWSRKRTEETVSLETKSAQHEAWLPGGSEVLACLTESLRRNSASAVAPGKTADLSFGPAEERLAGVPCGVGQPRGGTGWKGPGPPAATEAGAAEESLGGQGCHAARGQERASLPGSRLAGPKCSRAMAVRFPGHAERGEVPPRAPRPSSDLPPAPGPVGL